MTPAPPPSARPERIDGTVRFLLTGHAFGAVAMTSVGDIFAMPQWALRG